MLQSFKADKSYLRGMVVRWAGCANRDDTVSRYDESCYFDRDESPGKNTGVPEKEFWDRALQPVNDLDDGYVLFFEPKSETSKKAGLLSFGRIAKRTEGLDTIMSKECYGNQRKAIEDFREDKYDILGGLKRSKTPTLILMGDHDICFHVSDWIPLIGKLSSIQLIVMPRQVTQFNINIPTLRQSILSRLLNVHYLNFI